MNRLIGAFVVLGLIIAISTTGFLINTRTANSVKTKIEQSVRFADSGETDKARSTLNDAIEEWKNHIETMLLFESHGKLDEIEETINIAKSYITKDEYHLFYMECNLASTLLDHFEHLEYPNINNIL